MKVSHAARLAWMGGGFLSVGLAVAGILLPLLPTTPFVLLAAYCFARCSPRLHGWLLAHQTFGPLITNWQRERAIPRRAKLAAYGASAGTIVLSVALAVPTHLVALQVLALGASTIFVASRPEPRIPATAASPENDRPDGTDC